jgi:hypothetical protein
VSIKAGQSAYIPRVKNREVDGILQRFGSLSEDGSRARRSTISGIGYRDGVETHALTREISDILQLGFQSTTTTLSSSTVLSGGKVVSRPAGQCTGSGERFVVYEGEKHGERCQLGECGRGEHVGQELR